MTRPAPSPEFDPRIADWLEDDPDEAPGAVLETVLAAFPSIPQRRASRVPWRFLPMNRTAQLATVLVAAAVIAVGGFLILRPAGGRNAAAAPTDRPPSSAPVAQASPPSSIPPAPTPSPSASPMPLSADDVGRTLQPGTYRAAEFAAPFTITLPAGWVLDGAGPNDIGFALRGQGPISIAFAVIDKVYPDPCHPERGTRAVAPGVDGLVSALSSMKGFAVINAADVSIGGAAGKAFTLKNSISLVGGCRDKLPFATYQKASGAADLEMFPEERDLTWVLDAGGTTVIIFVNDSAASVQASQPVLSLSFQAASS